MPVQQRNINMSLTQNKTLIKNFFDNVCEKNKNFKIGFIGFGFVILALVIVIVVNLLAQPKPTVQQEVTITFWTRSISKDAINEIISEFEKENPLIKVKHEIQSDTDYKNRTITRLKSFSTNMANIVEVDESWIEELFTTLSPINDAKILSRYSTVSLNNNSFNNNVYGVPFRFDGLLLAYNKDHIAEIAFTEEDFNKLDWTSLANKAKSITKTKKSINTNNKQFDQILRSGAAIGSPRTVTNAREILKLLILQNDASFYNPQKKQYTLDAKFVEVTNFYGNFTVQNIWNDSLGNDIKSFAEGKTSIVFVRSADIDEILRLNPNLNFTTTIPPKIATLINISLSQSLVIPNYMPNYNESVKFLEFLTRNENSIKLFNAKGRQTFIPAQITTLNKIPRGSPFAAFSDINPTAQRLKSHDESHVNDILDNYLLEVYDNYYLTAIPGDKTPLNFEYKKIELALNNSIKKS